MARIRIIFEKKGWIIFINHMDLPVLFSRAARRAGLSQEFTQGFSPHPHISLCPPLAIGVEGRAEPAEFWFNEWHGGSAVYWNAKLPEGLKILQYAEVEGPALAKLATAAVYIITGAGFDLSCDAKAVLEEESKRAGILYSSSLDEGIVTLTVGGLENCGAGNFVRALKDSGICGGWSDLSIVRETVGTWDTENSRILSLI
ncbi:MAG: TIGR03936 family radical SAM-associated protein [Synergistaceae bacterium]|nr:TIGR03936 family radical SAM-associated protein [Synergistaceae bacterium]